MKEKRKRGDQRPHGEGQWKSSGDRRVDKLGKR